MKKTLAIVTAVMMMFIISSAIATKASPSSELTDIDLSELTLDDLYEMNNDELVDFLMDYYKVYKEETNAYIFD